jgi:hypothetical protein
MRLLATFRKQRQATQGKQGKSDQKASQGKAREQRARAQERESFIFMLVLDAVSLGRR